MHGYEKEKLDISATTLYVEIGENDNETHSDDDLVKILDDEDDRMDKILEDLLDIYSINKDKDQKEFEQFSQKEGVYMDVSFEYYPMESISHEVTTPSPDQLP